MHTHGGQRGTELRLACEQRLSVTCRRDK
jgi:hypothetical protein